MASGTVEIKLSPKVRKMIEGAFFPVLEENKRLKEENARLQEALTYYAYTSNDIVYFENGKIAKTALGVKDERTQEI